MKAEQLKQAAELYDLAQMAADAAVAKFNTLCDELGCPEAKLIAGTVYDVTECGVTIEWYETWRYGGHDEGSYDLCALELDPDTNDKYFRATIKRHLDAKNQKSSDEAKAKRKSDLAQLAKLKKEYGDD